MSRFDETAQYLKGLHAQEIVAELLTRAGCYVIKSYDYSGKDGNKAPRMFGAMQSYILPDLDVARNGKRWWAEVKYKDHPNLWRKTNTLEHGIDKRHYDHYLRVQSETGCHVWLFVFEESSQIVLAESLDRLGEPRFGWQYGHGGMVNWPRDRFRVRVPVAQIASAAKKIAAII